MQEGISASEADTTVVLPGPKRKNRYLVVAAVLLFALVGGLAGWMHMRQASTITHLKSDRTHLRSDKSHLTQSLADARSQDKRQKQALVVLGGQLTKVKKQVADAKKQAADQYSSGYSSGQAGGYAAGSNASYSSGYTDGYNSGYYDGYYCCG
jgi:hypothetical protein